LQQSINLLVATAVAEASAMGHQALGSDSTKTNIIV